MFPSLIPILYHDTVRVSRVMCKIKDKRRGTMEDFLHAPMVPQEKIRIEKR